MLTPTRALVRTRSAEVSQGLSRNTQGVTLIKVASDEAGGSGT